MTSHLEAAGGRRPSTAVRIVGSTLIGLLWLLLAVVLLAVGLEYFGISRDISRSWFDPYEKSRPIYLTDYYGKPLSSNPYAPVSVRFLHPFYWFSLPWRAEDRLANSNDIIHIDETGFRVNPFLGDQKAKAILLGGSTAFGDSASSDAHTISALLTQKTGMGFINRNAPGWPSHQEMVALAKYPGDYKLSLSFSFANNVSSYCRGASEGDKERIVGTSDIYDTIERHFNNLREAPIVSFDFKDRFSFEAMEKVIKRNFPDTHRLITQMTKKAEPKARTSKRGSWCKDRDVAPMVQDFLQDQLTMRQLSQARGAEHVLIIQPYYGLHASSNPEHWSKSKEEYEFRRKAIAMVMASPFCAKNCYDFSTLFDRLGGASHVNDNVGLTYTPRIFVDDVHLTDTGVDVMTSEIAKILATTNGQSVP